MLSGLRLNPHWSGEFGDAVAQRAQADLSGDDLPFAMAGVWLEDNYGLALDDNGVSDPYLRSLIYGWKYRTAERVFRETFIDFVKSHVQFMVELQFYYKPMLFAQYFLDWNTKALDAWHLVGGAILAGAFLVVLLSAATLGWAERGGVGGLMLFIGAGWAALPAIVIFPGFPMMSDQVMILDLALLGSGLLAAGPMVRKLGLYFSNRVRASETR